MNAGDGTISLIDPVKRAAMGQITVGGALEYAVTDGADRATRLRRADRARAGRGPFAADYRLREQGGAGRQCRKWGDHDQLADRGGARCGAGRCGARAGLCALRQERNTGGVEHPRPRSHRLSRHDRRSARLPARSTRATEEFSCLRPALGLPRQATSTGRWSQAALPCLSLRLALDQHVELAGDCSPVQAELNPCLGLRNVVSVRRGSLSGPGRCRASPARQGRPTGLRWAGCSTGC